VASNLPQHRPAQDVQCVCVGGEGRGREKEGSVGSVRLPGALRLLSPSAACHMASSPAACTAGVWRPLRMHGSHVDKASTQSHCKQSLTRQQAPTHRSSWPSTTGTGCRSSPC
jgi:hypothetical protein